MTNISRGDVSFRFALLSLVALAAIGGALVWLGAHALGERARDSAARAAATTVAPAVQSNIADLDLRSPLSGPAREELDARIAASGLLSDGVVRISVWNSSGIAVYSTRSDEIGTGFIGADELERAGMGEVPSVVEASDLPSTSGELFRVYAAAQTAGGDPVVVQIDQPYAPIGEAISASQRDWIIRLAVGMVGLYGVLQVAFWFTTRAIARLYSRLNYLYTTAQQLRSSLDLGEVAGQLVRDAVALAQGTYAVLVLVEEESGDMVLRASFDREKETVAYHNRRVDEWFLGRVVATGEPVATKMPERPYRTIFGFHSGADGPVSILSAPMSLRERVSGVIAVIRYPSVRDFQASEISLVVELAGQAAMAIEQASLFAKVREYAAELEVSYDNTLRALMAALDTKDAATEGHSERVSRLSVNVAREMGFPEERLVDIERGALLHDVGKIGVPDSVLRKPGSLSKKEWDAMQKHPLLAGLMVSKVGFLEGAMPILLYHHERFDGGGYPFGLSGDQIPLEARIFAVVDTYDAITSERPYRGASSAREAVDEIKANAGTQFDPAVVGAFTAVIERHLAGRAERETREAA